MNYQISFDGALSAALANLLRSVEGQLNGQALLLQAQAAGTTGTPPRCSCPPGQLCLFSIKIGHDACVSAVELIVGTAVVTAFILVPIAYLLGKRSAAQVRS